MFHGLSFVILELGTDYFGSLDYSIIMIIAKTSFFNTHNSSSAKWGQKTEDAATNVPNCLSW